MKFSRITTYLWHDGLLTVGYVTRNTTSLEVKSKYTKRCTPTKGNQFRGLTVLEVIT